MGENKVDISPLLSEVALSTFTFRFKESFFEVLTPKVYRLRECGEVEVCVQLPGGSSEDISHI